MGKVTNRKVIIRKHTKTVRHTNFVDWWLVNNSTSSVLDKCYVLVAGRVQVGSGTSEGRQGREDVASTYRLRPRSTRSPISDERTDRSKGGGNDADIQNEVQTELVGV